MTRRFIVNGFTPAQVRGLVAQDCAGKTGEMTLVGKPRKRRGHHFQKYKTTCAGGLSSKYKGNRAAFDVEQQPDGRNMVEITTSDGAGNIIFLREFR